MWVKGSPSQTQEGKWLMQFGCLLVFEVHLTFQSTEQNKIHCLVKFLWSRDGRAPMNIAVKLHRWWWWYCGEVHSVIGKRSFSRIILFLYWFWRNPEQQGNQVYLKSLFWRWICHDMIPSEFFPEEGGLAPIEELPTLESLHRWPIVTYKVNVI